MNSNLNLGWERIFVLEPVDGKPKNVIGIVDPRLFNGENNLVAVKDIETCMWTLRYQKGILPNELKQTFTSFSALTKYVTHYYKTRNIRIKEIKD